MTYRMKVHHKTMEWVGVVTLAIMTVIAYLIFTGSQILTGTQATLAMEAMILLMLFGAMIVSIIVQLRIYGALEEIEATLKVKKVK